MTTSPVWEVSCVVPDNRTQYTGPYSGAVVAPTHRAVITVHLHPRWAKRPLWLWSYGLPTTEFIRVVFAPHLAKAFAAHAAEHGEEIRVAMYERSTWQYDVAHYGKLDAVGAFQIAVSFVHAKDELQIFTILNAVLPQVMEIFDE